MAPQASALWRSLKTYQIYGANTNVGKTIMSTVLCKALARKIPTEHVWYLKPVSTGPLDEADDRHISRFAPKTKTKCLFQFDEAVSPHIAARSSKQLPDTEIRQEVLKHIGDCVREGPGTLILETAGGVHSPTPSGTSQSDLYRPLRIPICLVADHRLGGISASISAFESLHIRGYDLDAVLQFEDFKYQNHAYLKDYFEKRGIQSLSLPAPPPQGKTLQEDMYIMTEYYEKMSKLDVVEETLVGLSQKHDTRIRNLEEMAIRANDQIWYPFTQHRDVSPKSILTIDSASGDFFQTHNLPSSSQEQHVSKEKNHGDSPLSMLHEEKSILEPTFDGSASWWTQGLGHGNPELSLAAAYAAGRYGHVMFAGTIHEPALLLAENLLQNLQNPRMSKVFFSDNGSTGIEVATKMALTASFERYKWNIPKSEVGVIGLKGSYHGDTIGAMDCSEPSVYNEKVHWYKGRGHWFDFPKVYLDQGSWRVDMPEEMFAGGDIENSHSFPSLAAIFDIEARTASPQAARYREHISRTLEGLIKDEGKTFGAVILEPVILGAGGMLMADPLFQHLLVSVIRSSSDLFGPSSYSSTFSGTKTWTGLPIIHDEVFTGLYRLGRFSSSSFLQLQPDISVHAKLLTGGLVPLCCTVSSESIYEAFLGTDKKDALLHGHSYTGHAVGCHVANTSLNALMAMDRDGSWQVFRDEWKSDREMDESSLNGVELWSAWSSTFIKELSMFEHVENVIALGSVLAITLRDDQGGYTSTAAAGLQKYLMQGSKGIKIHSRVLGNVLYLMGGQTTTRETLERVERAVMEGIKR